MTVSQVNQPVTSSASQTTTSTAAAESGTEQPAVSSNSAPVSRQNSSPSLTDDDDDGDDDDGAATSISDDANDLVCDLVPRGKRYGTNFDVDDHQAVVSEDLDEFVCNLVPHERRFGTNFEEKDPHTMLSKNNNDLVCDLLPRGRYSGTNFEAEDHQATVIEDPDELVCDLVQHGRHVGTPQAHAAVTVEDDDLVWDRVPHGRLSDTTNFEADDHQAVVSEDANDLVCDPAPPRRPLGSPQAHPKDIGEHQPSTATPKFVNLELPSAGATGKGGGNNWVNCSHRRRKSTRPQWHYEGTVLDKSHQQQVQTTAVFTGQINLNCLLALHNLGLVGHLPGFGLENTGPEPIPAYFFNNLLINHT